MTQCPGSWTWSPSGLTAGHCGLSASLDSSGESRVEPKGHVSSRESAKFRVHIPPPASCFSLRLDGCKAGLGLQTQTCLGLNQPLLASSTSSVKWGRGAGPPFRNGSHERCVGALGSSCMLILPSNHVPPGPQVMAALALHGMSGCIYDFVL